MPYIFPHTLPFLGTGLLGFKKLYIIIDFPHLTHGVELFSGWEYSFWLTA